MWPCYLRLLGLHFSLFLPPHHIMGLPSLKFSPRHFVFRLLPYPRLFWSLLRVFHSPRLWFTSQDKGSVVRRFLHRYPRQRYPSVCPSNPMEASSSSPWPCFDSTVLYYPLFNEVTLYGSPYYRVRSDSRSRGPCDLTFGPLSSFLKKDLVPVHRYPGVVKMVGKCNL